MFLPQQRRHRSGGSLGISAGNRVFREACFGSPWAGLAREQLDMFGTLAIVFLATSPDEAPDLVQIRALHVRFRPKFRTARVAISTGHPCPARHKRIEAATTSRPSRSTLAPSSRMRAHMPIAARLAVECMFSMALFRRGSPWLRPGCLL